MHLEHIEQKIIAVNEANGWEIPSDAWDKEGIISDKLLLIVEEISEAMREYRKNNFTKFKEELGDVFIRLIHLSKSLNIDMQYEVMRKVEINAERLWRHGDLRA